MSSPYGGIGGEETRRSPVTDEAGPEEKLTPTKECPVCKHVSAIPLCFYFWLGQAPVRDSVADREVAYGKVDAAAGRHDACDIWVCFVCSARTHFESNRSWVPAAGDLTLESFMEVLT